MMLSLQIGAGVIGVGVVGVGEVGECRALVGVTGSVMDECVGVKGSVAPGVAGVGVRGVLGGAVGVVVVGGTCAVPV